MMIYNYRNRQIIKSNLFKTIL